MRAQYTMFSKVGGTTHVPTFFSIWPLEQQQHDLGVMRGVLGI
jgi:hypothetical protein